MSRIEPGRGWLASRSWWLADVPSVGFPSAL